MSGSLLLEISTMGSILGIIILGSIFAIISNSAIDRIPKNQSVTNPGPYCKSCAAKLLWKDLIPVVSYIRSKGKCPYCSSPIPLRNLIVDVAQFLWITIFIVKFGWSYDALLEMMFGIGLIAVIAIEKENRRLSDMVLLLLGTLTVIYLLAYKSDEFPSAALSFVIGGGILLLYEMLTILARARKHIDLSEVKFGAILGLFLGLPQVALCVFLAIFTGAVLGSFRIKFLKSDYQTSIPAFPILMAASGLVTILFGQDILVLYDKMLM